MMDLNDFRRAYSGRTPGLLGARHSYAVLCPLVEREDGLHLLFEVRSSHVAQPGEVCFPGGRVEPGEDVVTAALRETQEELAIPPEHIEVLGTPDFICNQKGFLLQPVLGLLSEEGLEALAPSPAEVQETFLAPLSFFAQNPPEVYTYKLLPQVPPDFPYAEIGVSPDYPWSQGRVEVPVWHWGRHVVWGMTGRIVRSLIQG